MAEKQLPHLPEKTVDSNPVQGEITDTRKNIQQLFFEFDDLLDHAADSLAEMLWRGGVNVAHNLGGASAAFGRRIMAWEKTPKKNSASSSTTNKTNQAA